MLYFDEVEGAYPAGTLTIVANGADLRFLRAGEHVDVSFGDIGCHLWSTFIRARSGTEHRIYHRFAEGNTVRLESKKAQIALDLDSEGYKISTRLRHRDGLYP